MTNNDISKVDALQDYVKRVKCSVSSDKRRACLISLMQFMLDERLGCSKIEEEEYMGRSYMILGNMIIDIRGDIHWHHEHSFDRIKDYLLYLRVHNPGHTYIVVVTDGLRFHAYMPKYNESGQVLELERLQGMNLASSLITPQQALNDLGVILSNFTLRLT